MGIQITEKKMIRAGMLFFLFVLLLGGYVFFSLSDTKEGIKEQYLSKQLLKTIHIAENIEDRVNDLEGDLLTLSTYQGIQTLDLGQQSRELALVQNFLGTEIFYIARIDPLGRVVERSSSEIYKIPSRVLNEAYLGIPRVTQRPYTSEIRDLNEELVIFVSVPLFTDQATGYLPSIEGEFQGVILSILSWENLYSSFIFPIIIEDDSSYALLSSDGRMVDTDLDNQTVQVLKLSEKLQRIALSSESYEEEGVFVSAAPVTIGSEEYALFIITDQKSLGGEFIRVQTSSIIFIIIILLFGVGAVAIYNGVVKDRDTTLIEQDEEIAKIALEDKELQILNILKDAELGNKAVTFKEITKFCNITKPTTRAKISQLKKKGLILVEKQGRTKVVLLTKKGRKQV